jgi:hypothetical protein
MVDMISIHLVASLQPPQAAQDAHLHNFITCCNASVLCCAMACTLLPARPQDEAGRPAIADAGGSIITGIDGNPLAVLAAQLGLPLHNIDSTDVPLYLADGSQPDKQLDEEVGAEAGEGST